MKRQDLVKYRAGRNLKQVSPQGIMRGVCYIDAPRPGR